MQLRVSLVEWMLAPAVACGLGLAGPVRADEAPAAPMLDAEVRVRGTWSERLQGIEANQDAFRRAVFERVRLGVGFRHQALSAYVQLQQTGVFGGQAPTADPVPIGVQQAVVRADLPASTGLRFEAGRMVLDYGAGRMVGAYDFHPKGQAFDGVRLSWQAAQVVRADVIAVKLRRDPSEARNERNLVGLYATARPADALQADVYCLYLTDRDGTGRLQTATIGARLEGRVGKWLSAEVESAVQAGSRAIDDTVTPLDHLATALAGSLAVDASAVLPLQLTLHAQMYSGDSEPTDNVDHAWRPLYPSLDQVTGLMQLFRPSNLGQAGAKLGARWQTLSLELDGFGNYFHANAALPGFGGVVTPGDDAWAPLGPELDVRARWRPLERSEVLLAGGLLWPERAVPAAVGDTEAQRQVRGQVLLQWNSRF
jgi:hypothetical protein